MISVCLYFQIHQPFRLRRDYNFFQIGRKRDYFDDDLNREVVQRTAQECYLPANQIILDLIRKYRGRFRVCYSISGTALDQFEAYAPEVIESFRELVRTNCVEFLNETYYHSLAFQRNRDEFEYQVKLHRDRIKHFFGYTPKCFRNTELIYNNKLAHAIEDMGYQAILTEGANQILGWRTPNFVYQPSGCEKLKLLLRNYRLSDDLSFRFSSKHYKHWPITPRKYTDWIADITKNGEVVNIFLDYETFGEHHKADTGIFQFLQEFPAEVLSRSNIYFQTPCEIAETFEPMSRIDVPFYVSWADVERDLTAWVGNPMQDSALENLYKMREKVLAKGDDELALAWRRLQTSDHFYYMCTKWFSDGDVHRYFNPFASPHDAYLVYCNVLNDMRHRIRSSGKSKETAARK